MNGLQNLHPKWIAAIIAIAIIVWMASGQLEQQSAETAAVDTAEQQPVAERQLRKVRVAQSQAAELVREGIVSARTAPKRTLNIQAETSGRVVSVGAERGDAVEAGQIVIKLDLEDREAQLAKAQAVQRQRQLQFEAAERLRKQGHQTEVDLSVAKANLLTAKAEVQKIQRDLQNVTIKAPFDGILETRSVEVGDYVNAGQLLGSIIQQDPFVVRGFVPEDIIGWLKPGQTASARLKNGEIRTGTLSYVASQADENTRTFRVELEIPAGEGRLVVGTSAVLIMPLETVVAHEVAPSVLALSKDGQLGVKTVNADNIVEFHTGEIVQNRDNKVWLTGLPGSLQIITVGQGFVTAGDRVEPVSSAAQAE